MKSTLKLTFMLGLIISLNSCALFGGGKKCNDCPSWSNNTQTPQQDIKVEKERI